MHVPQHRGRQIRTLYVISHYELGGAECYVLELVRLLRGQVKAGVVAVIGDDHSDFGRHMTQLATEYGAITYRGSRFPWKFGGALLAALRLRHVIRCFKPDIVHLNTEVPEFAYALCLSMDRSVASIPVIRTIHNTNLWQRWAFLGRKCERVLRNATSVCVSDTVRQSFNRWRSACGLDAVGEALTIYNPITIPRIRSSLWAPRIRQELRLLFAGRFEVQKGCDLLPAIIRKTKPHPDKRLKLFIYGDGSQKALLDRFRQSPPAGWDIELFPPKHNLVESLPDFDILLFPSRFEGYGRLAAEAVLVGIPVVAFRLPVLFEVFPPNYPWLAALDEGAVSNFAEKLSSLIMSFEASQDAVDLARGALNTRLMDGSAASAYVKLYESKLMQPTPMDRP